MVTSTSTPGSMLIEVICFTISDGECKSMIRLWIRIWNWNRKINAERHRLATLSFYLEAIPSFRTFTARCLTRCDAQCFGWHTDRPLDTEFLLLGAANQIGTYFLQRAYVLRCQGDTNAVHLWHILFRFFNVFACRCLWVDEKLKGKAREFCGVTFRGYVVVRNNFIWGRIF